MGKRIEIEIAGEVAGLRRAVQESQSALGSLGSGLGRVAKTAAFAAGAAGIGAIALTLKTGISEWKESTKVAAQTEAVIKSTGGSAHITAKQVDELATSIMKKSGIDDEAIKSGENMLLTFTNIRNEAGKGNDVFNQSTQILADMSTALGTDMNKSAIQLGKALNDPIKGITALTRVGVSFTKGQKDQIEAMVKAGDTMGAQKLILAELNKEFGGSAEAIGKTLPGQLNILKESFNNFAGDLVARAAPELQRFVSFINQVTLAPTWHAKLQIIWEGLENVAMEMAGKLKVALLGSNEKVRVDLNEWVEIHHEGLLEKMKTDLSARVNAIDWGGVFVGMFKSIDWGALLSATFHAIITISKTQWTVVAEIWLGAWRAIFTGLQALGVLIVSTITDALSRAVAAVRNAAAGALSAAVALGAGILNGLRSGVSGLVGVIRDKLDDLYSAIRGAISAAGGAAKMIGQAIVTGIISGLGGLFTTVASYIAGKVRAAIDFARDHLGSTAEQYAAANLGHPLGLGVISGFHGALARAALLAPLKDAKADLDGWALTKGVANMLSVGKAMRDALTAGFTAGEHPILAGTSFMPTIAPGPFNGLISEPRDRSQSPDGAIQVNVNVEGSVVTERDLIESVRSGLIQTQLRQGTIGFR